MTHTAMQGHLQDDLIRVDGVGGEQVVFRGVADQFCDANGHLGGFQFVEVFDAADYASCNWKNEDRKL